MSSILECPPPLRSRQYVGGPTIFWLLLNKIGVIGGAFWDIPVSTPFPCNVFFIASQRAGDEANSLWMSIMPTNKPRGTAFTAMTGQEQIFPLNGSPIIAASPHYYSVLRFRDPLPQTLYFHMGSENGNLSRYTIGCAQDGELSLQGGIYH